MRAAKSMVVLMLSLLAGCSSVVAQRYDVHDLFAGTVDYPYSPAELEKARNKKMHDLIDVISTSIGHESWRTIQYPDGGAAPTRADSAALGTITAKDGTLIISQRPEIQTQIASLLAILRQDRVQEVSIETRFMLVDDHFIENLGRDDPNRGQPVVAKTYSDIAKLFSSQSSRSGILGTLDQFQGDVLIRASQVSKETISLSAPRVTFISGEKAHAGVTSTHDILFKTSTTEVGTPAVKVAPVISGLAMDAQAAVAPNQKQILLKFSYIFYNTANGPVTATVTTLVPDSEMLVLAPVKIDLVDPEKPGVSEKRTLLVLVKTSGLIGHRLAADLPMLHCCFLQLQWPESAIHREHDFAVL